jgi:hypothetical protein
MVIPIPIPIGSKRTAVVRGAVWKLVDCSHCGGPYACQVQLEASAQDVDLLFLDSKGSRERAREQAMQHFLRQTANCVVPVPCPHCGSYQQPMARQMKESAWVNRQQIAGLVIATVSLIFLALPFAYSWIATILVAIVGIIVMTRGYIIAYRFDANAGDPEPRKRFAQKHAVWGEELQALIDSGQIVGTKNGDAGRGELNR